MIKNLILPGGVVGGITRLGPDSEGPSELVNLRRLGIVPVPAGGARGYNTAGDVLTQTADGRDLNEVWNEFQAALGVYNEQRDLLVRLLTFPVQQPIESVPTLAEGDFEEASEFGEPKGVRGGGYTSFGFDFRWFDLAVRYTWQFLAEAAQGQLDALNEMALEADNRLVFDKVMKAIFNNVNRTATIRETAVNVYPFYNNDGTTPPKFKNTTFASTHNHYVTSGAATVDSVDLKDLAKLITEHGYGKGAGGQLILLANSQQVSAIRGFRISTGAEYDFIPAIGSPPSFYPADTLGIQGGQPPAQYAGLDVAGRYGPWLIIEEDYVPAGYMVGFASGGDVAVTNPVGIREHANGGLRGLQLVKGLDPDYPLIDSFYRRGFGTGIRHRGAGAVMQITTAAAYAIPASYA